MKRLSTSFLLVALACTFGLLGGGIVMYLRSAEASRNSAGTYSLASSPVTTLQTISTSLWNNTFSDLATGVTDSLDRNGRGGMLAAIRVVDGTFGAPAFSWTAETGSGYYRIGAGDFGFSILGVKTGEWTANGLRVANGVVGTPSLSFFNDTASGLYRAGSNDLRFAVNGADVQKWIAAGSAITGTLSTTGALTIGSSGNAITGSFSGSSAVTGAVVTSGTCRTADTITVTGAASGDPCFLGPPAAGAGPAISPSCYVSSANTVTIELCNIDNTSNHTSTTGTYKARVFN